MNRRLTIHAHIWLLARVYPFSSVWLGDLLYCKLIGRSFEPLQMLPLKLFCVATISFPFLVLSGYARLRLQQVSASNTAGILWAAIFLVLASTSLQGAIFYSRFAETTQLEYWHSLLNYSPIFMLILIPCGMKAERLFNRAARLEKAAATD